MSSSYHIKVSCEVPSGFVVDQVRGMIDLDPQKIATETFDVEVPDQDEDWSIGVIVGPSGSGKSTVARDIYGKNFVEGYRWDKKKSVVEQFGKTSIKEISQALTAVGFSSPPSWIKPYHVLSGGERFRCDLARAMLANGSIVAFDEFTSVVDRTVAKIGSAAVAKSIRKGRVNKKFVAVGCHYDILDWLEPDWVLDMATGQLARGRLWQRPAIKLKIKPAHRSVWNLFRRHHYLDTNLMGSATSFVAYWEGEPVAFCSWVNRMACKSRKGDMRGHRTVVLPDFQGVGIGNKVSEACASIWPAIGGRAFSVTSHPGMIHYRNQSKNWKTIRCGMVNPPNKTLKGNNSIGRITATFRYIGPLMQKELAQRMAGYFPAQHIYRVAMQLGATTIDRIAEIAGYAPATVRKIMQEKIDEGQASRFRAGGNRWIYEAPPN